MSVCVHVCERVSVGANVLMSMYFGLSPLGGSMCTYGI